MVLEEAVLLKLFGNEVVITSPNVQNYHLDASTGWISLALVALANGGK